MTEALDPTATVRDLLFGAGSTAALQDSLRGTVRAHVPDRVALTGAVEHKLTAKMDALLSRNLADVAVDAWKTYDRLIDAARYTRDHPKATELVELVTHKLEWSQDPTIEMLANRRTLATLHITLQLAFTIHAAVVTIEQGCLTEVRVARCIAGGSLSVQGHKLAEQKRDFDLPGAVRLRHRIPLLDRVGVRPLMARPQ